MIADIAVKCFRKPFDIAMCQQKAGIVCSCQYGAGILGEKPTAVTTRLARARQKLKQLLEKEGYDEY